MRSSTGKGKLWFCTNNQKDVYKDMQANPNIEISVSSPAYAWIRPVSYTHLDVYKRQGVISQNVNQLRAGVTLV